MSPGGVRRRRSAGCWALVLGLALGACAKSVDLPHRVHLLDVGFPVELTGATLSTRPVQGKRFQYRVMHLPPGGGCVVRGVYWPGRGSFSLSTGADSTSPPSAGADLEVLLTAPGGRELRLGSVRLHHPSGEGFVTQTIAFEGLDEGVYDVSMKLRSPPGEQGSWLCDGGVLAYEGPFRPVDRPADAGPNLVLVVVDTLRLDHLSLYGYPRRTAPQLERIAATGMTFANLRAQASWTKPSTATILTGVGSYEHGAVSQLDILADRVWTLSEQLQTRGYITAAFIANGWIGNARFNFNQGYDHFVKVDGKAIHDGASADEVLDRATAWMAENGNRPFFLFVHLIDPHAPYSPPEDLKAEFDRGYSGTVKPYPVEDERDRIEPGFMNTPLVPEDVAHLVDLYDAEIAHTDRCLGAFMDALKALDLASSTVLLITSDHGEEFHDHGGLQHGATLYEEQLRAPLIATGPGIPVGGQMFEPMVRHMDIAPMALGLLGLEPCEQFRGRDPLAGDARPVRVALSDLDQFQRRGVAVRVGDLKLIQSYEPEAWVRLFDLAEDPFERNDIAADFADQVDRLRVFTRSHASPIFRPGLYIACRSDDRIQEFRVQIGAEEKPVDQFLFRLCEKDDGFERLEEVQGVRFIFRSHRPGDIDVAYIVSDLGGRYGLSIHADGELLAPSLIQMGRRGPLTDLQQLVVADAFADAVIDPLPPIDLEALLPPGSAAILRVLPSPDTTDLPQETIEELKAMGYLGY